MSKCPTETAQCEYCCHKFTRQVRKGPRRYCSVRCQRLDEKRIARFDQLPADSRYEDRQHIQLDYEGRVEDE